MIEAALAGQILELVVARLFVRDQADSSRLLFGRFWLRCFARVLRKGLLRPVVEFGSRHQLIVN